MADPVPSSFLIEVSAPLPNIRHPGEDWSGITNTTKRRRLQNRLNQRARRRRDRARQDDFADGLHIVEQHLVPVLQQEIGPSVRRELSSEDSYDIEGSVTTESPCLLGQPENRDALLQLARECYNRYKVGAINTTDLSGVVRFNIFHAFAVNARVLGFNDDWLTYEATSPFNTAGDASRRLLPARRPPMMEPTTLQLTVEHHPWIDFFPCPRLRDNLLKAVEPGHETVDEDALCSDVVDAGARAGIGSAALLVWGNPWEPGGWEVTESFLTKWGWLLDGCTALIESTNYWRRKRGLKSLEVDGLRLQVSPA